MAENRNLDAEKISDTLKTLKLRVHDRFPKRGLDHVCGDLLAVAEATAVRIEETRGPAIILRLAAVLVIALAALMALPLFDLVAPVVIAAFSEGTPEHVATTAGEMMQAFESGVNLIILAALAIWFLVSLETRWKRRKVLNHLHELRSFAHVVDMHQLTKDPVSILNPSERLPTSPQRDLTPFQLTRYLDYCVEMLSMIGKLAALYAEHTEDHQIISTANDIEALTTNLSRKIWQKIQLIGDEAAEGQTAPRAPSQSAVVKPDGS